MNYREKALKIVIAALLVMLHVQAFPAPNNAQVEAFARAATEAANREFVRTPPTDGVTQSQRAYAAGKQIIYEYVLAIRKDASEKHLSVWRASVRSEVFPAACAAMKGNEFFDNGLVFRYRYLERSGAVLDDFIVNKPSCKGL